ncbi:hypothetical protein D7D81_18235 [Halocella sp. SP3-1]|nr:hypothetical protein [Halocella sp. SP3-1]AZO96373.1 hypothetical protein D7D81_18235 [Halocella sp. SP3-1]
MEKEVGRKFVEKKAGFAESLYKEFKLTLGIEGLKEVRVVNRYDIEGISTEEYQKSRNTIFAEPPVDNIHDEKFTIPARYKVIAIEYLPGQYDQRADSSAQCIQLLIQNERPEIRCAKLILIAGNISKIDYKKIKEYCINPLEAREALLSKPETLKLQVNYSEKVKIIDNFIEKNNDQLKSLYIKLGLAMSLEDLKFGSALF